MHEHDSIRDGTNVRQRVADGGYWDLFFAEFTDRENFRFREMKRDSILYKIDASLLRRRICRAYVRCCPSSRIALLNLADHRGHFFSLSGVVALELRCLQILRLGAG
jgi:hypothetical protein